MSFFEIGPGEILIILFVALLLFGPAKIVGIARSLGKWMHDFQKAASNFTAEVNKEIEDASKAANEATKVVNKEISGFNAAVRNTTAEVNNDINTAVAGMKQDIGNVNVSPPHPEKLPVSPSQLPQAAAPLSGQTPNPPAKL